MCCDGACAFAFGVHHSGEPGGCNGEWHGGFCTAEGGAEVDVFDVAEDSGSEGEVVEYFAAARYGDFAFSAAVDVVEGAFESATLGDGAEVLDVGCVLESSGARVAQG